MSSRTKALLAIVIASLLWATAGLSKVVVQAFDPYMAAFLRFFVAAIFITPLFLREKARKPLGPLLFVSLLSTANIAFYYVGLQTSTASAAVLIYAGVPLFTTILAHVLIGENINARKIVGILVGLIGVAFVALLPALEKGQVISGAFPGNFFFLGAVLVWTLYMIYSRRMTNEKGYSPITITSASIFTTCAVFLGISLFTFEPSYIPRIMDPTMLFYIVYLGVGVTVATYLLLQIGIQLSSAATASLTNYLQPAFALMFNAVFLGEVITPLLVIGIILVFTGIMITSGSQLLTEMRTWVKH